MSKNSLNKVMLIGNLGGNPDQRYLPNGTCVSSFSVATTETYNKGEEKKERTEWHHVVFFGKLAEVIGKYVTKGCKIYIEGSLKTEKWERKDGGTGNITKILGNKFLILQKKLDREPEETAGLDDAEFSGVGDDVPF